jgi:hypothetical protein
VPSSIFHGRGRRPDSVRHADRAAVLITLLMGLFIGLRFGIVGCRRRSRYLGDADLVAWTAADDQWPTINITNRPSRSFPRQLHRHPQPVLEVPLLCRLIFLHHCGGGTFAWSNAESARLSGVSVPRILIAYGPAMFGLVGHTGLPWGWHHAGRGWELQAIASTVEALPFGAVGSIRAADRASVLWLNSNGANLLNVNLPAAHHHCNDRSSSSTSCGAGTLSLARPRPPSDCAAGRHELNCFIR